jgi:hypothetical protein
MDWPKGQQNQAAKRTISAVPQKISLDQILSSDSKCIALSNFGLFMKAKKDSNWPRAFSGPGSSSQNGNPQPPQGRIFLPTLITITVPVGLVYWKENNDKSGIP